MNKEVRWKQRYINLEKAFNKLEESVKNVSKLNVLEKEGLIQRFEYTFELSWKTLKDYLESQEVDAKFPREVIKEAFKYEIISDGDIWMEMLEKRNLITHTYNDNIFKSTIDSIVKNYFDSIKQVFNFFKSKQK